MGEGIHWEGQGYKEGLWGSMSSQYIIYMCVLVKAGGGCCCFLLRK